MPARIRLARATDAAAIRAIYAPFVEHAVVSFEYEVPSIAEVEERIQAVLAFAPWIVWEDDGRVLGYAYGSRFRARTAYQWTAEVSIYVHESCRGQGVGRRLYSALFDLLRAQGFHLAVGGATLPNEASVALHEGLGFTRVGSFGQVGYKHGAWHDVGFWQLVLGPGSAPRAPRTPAECAHDPAWIEVFGARFEGARRAGG